MPTEGARSVRKIAITVENFLNQQKSPPWTIQGALSGELVRFSSMPEALNSIADAMDGIPLRKSETPPPIKKTKKPSKKPRKKKSAR